MFFIAGFPTKRKCFCRLRVIEERQHNTAARRRCIGTFDVMSDWNMFDIFCVPRRLILMNVSNLYE